MIEVCGCPSLKKIKVEGDVGADALWCAVCGYNLDLEEFNFSKRLKSELNRWMNAYGEWIDWDKDALKENANEEIIAHNEIGQSLTKEVQKELVDYEVIFKPTSLSNFFDFKK